ncbi:ABC transporter ATP-binding protein [Massilia sp. W12]|uniref:ABC transporter ATP-binding protein n=1 Tax=Massilia sp. W12 TaxID=3126507 RepID=UPI0030D54C6A
MIELHGVGKCWPNGAQAYWALRGVDLQVAAGEALALCGPSGSGKSSLLALAGGLLKPDEGYVSIGGTRLDSLSAQALDRFRGQQIGIIFQRFNLLPVLSAQENVEMALVMQNLSAAERKRRAGGWLEQVGLSHRADVRAALLSGGEQQRVAIARALAPQPRIVLADEPSANLDRKNAVQFLQILRRLQQENGVTLVIATHDALVHDYVQRVQLLEDGKCLA